MSEGHRSKRVVLTMLLLLMIVGVLLYVGKCDRAPGTGPGEFDYFAAKAAELGHDPARIVAWVRDEVRDLSYRGDVKGPLGALWDGAASPEEKLALAKAVLGKCAHTEAGAPTVALGDVAPGRDGSADGAGVSHSMKIVHRLVKPDGSAVETPVYEGPPGAFVGDVHSIEVPAWGKTRFVLRGGASGTVEVETLGGIGEEVAFTVPRPGREAATTVRELWRRGNRTGPTLPIKGDRHDFVVLPCRVTEYVMKKEAEILKAAGRDESDDGKHYRGLLEYCFRSDGALADLERRYKVRASFDSPRVLILSKLNLYSKYGGPSYAFDLRWNRTSFEGDRFAAYAASQVRGFMEAGAEQLWLSEWSKRACSSAFDVFSRIRDDYPDHPARRTKLIQRALEALDNETGEGAEVTFAALPHGPGGGELAKVVAYRAGDGTMKIRGGAPAAEMAAALEERGMALPLEGGKLGGVFDKDIGRSALTVENALLASGGTTPVPSDYVLKATMDPGRERLVVAGTVMRFLNPANGVHSIYWMKDVGESVSFRFRVWNASLKIPGTLVLSKKALENSRVFDSFYYDEDRTYDDKVSFVISRAMYRDVKAGRKTTYSLSNKRDEERVLEAGPAGTIKAKVNGREMELPVLKCKRGEKELFVYDDGLLPILNMQRLQYLSTTVRCRLVDRKGVGIAGARVELAGKGISAKTWPDGAFRLPPPPEKGYGAVTMVVSRNDEEYGRVAVDLSAPGTEVVTVTCPRRRMRTAWLAPDDHGELAGLEISDQVKRHIRGFIGRGESVLVPSRMVPTAGGGVIAFYAFDARTGDITAVCESGLHGGENGSREKYEEYENDLKDWAKEQGKEAIKDALSNSGLDEDVADALGSFSDDLIDSGGKGGMIETLHFYRGSLAAWYGYSRHRIGQDDKTDHTLAIKNTLKEMNAWADGLDLFANIEDPTGLGLDDKYRELVGKAMPGVTGSAAKAAFKAGYLTALFHINKEFGSDPAVK